MGYLVTVTLIWAFSFSLIGEFLAGEIDSYFAVVLRVLIAALIFLPMTSFKRVSWRLRGILMGIGAVQIGFMYLFFYHSFNYLSVPEVVLFTIFTPIYVTLIYDAFKGTFRPLYLLSATIAVFGAYVIRYHEINSGFIFGFLMVQGANICFALGQTLYKRVMESYTNIDERKVFGYFHFGAFLVTSVAFLLFGNMERIYPSTLQWGVLFWLGVVASGFGYFMWNKGACKVDAGTLAIMNNVLVPVGLFVNLFIWGKPTNIIFLILGSTIIAFSLWLHTYFIKRYQAVN